MSTEIRVSERRNALSTSIPTTSPKLGGDFIIFFLSIGLAGI
jgi:hypothetical protein